MNPSKFALYCFLIMLPHLTQAAPFKINEGKVEFLATGRPGALKIAGKSIDEKALTCDFSLNGNTLSGSSQFKLDALDTGISLRDKHMKEKYLETGKFPEAHFRITKLALPANFEAKEIPFTGLLKLHGVEKPISGIVKSYKKNTNLGLVHEFKIKTSDFAISTPAFMGVTMAEEVQITVYLEGTVN